MGSRNSTMVLFQTTRFRCNARLSYKHNPHFTDETLSWILTHWMNYRPLLITILSFQQTHHKKIRRP